MELFEYEIIGNKSRYPIYLKDRQTIVLRLNKKYKYYIEVRSYDSIANEYIYYILFSADKINESCKQIKYDDYGREKIKVTFQTHNEIINIIKNKNRFDLTFDKAEEEYDRYIIE